MSPQERFVPLAESRKARLPDARVVSSTAPDDRIDVTVLVGGPSRGRVDGNVRPLTVEEYASAYSAQGSDLELVAEYAASRGLTVGEMSLVKRTVELHGPADAVSQAFDVDLTTQETDHTTYRGRSGVVSVPERLARVVQGIFGIDDRPQASPHFRRAMRAEPTGGFFPTEVAALYQFPTDIDGTGQTIAIVEFGGGYRSRDLTRYFAELGIRRPKVGSISVDGSRNKPTGSADGPDAEVTLDIEIAGAVASGARIVVYFAPNTSRGFLDAILAAVHHESGAPAALSISWGAPELAWTRQSLRAVNEAFQAAALLGTTVCAASGDAGSSDGVADGNAHVDFPASSPYVLACGGTRLEADGSSVRSERAWGGGHSRGATGGGVSEAFARPDWQADVHVPPSLNPPHHRGRGVPDIAANADPETGYRVIVHGEPSLIGGTSAVAPLMAGLVALVNQRLRRRCGHVNPVLYGAGPRVFRDVTHGSNGAFSARRGWDACTGLGSPLGTALIAALEPKASGGLGERATPDQP